MRVLLCNWVDPFDAQRRGGGVAVWQRNLAPVLAGAGVQASFLSSGLVHDLRARPPGWRAMARPGHYELVNSAVLAPGQASFGDPRQVHDPATEAAFADFLARNGPFDAVHFDNLEGLPAGVLRVARASGARVTVMLHNYYPFCPQVNLWWQERAHCDDFRNGARCTSCLSGPQASVGQRRLGLALDGLAGRWGCRGLWRRGHGLLRTLVRALRRRSAARPAQPPGRDGAAAARFGTRRTAMLAALNGHADAVLCVSDRVRAIAAGFGVAPGLLHTARIGSPGAESYEIVSTRPLVTQNGRIRLAYLGYMRRDKGFFFLAEALAALPADLAARIELVVAARADPAGMAQLAALRPHLAAVIHHDGYGAADLDRILAGVTLGVVPVLWQDNLPQVALEMHLRGVTLLCSDMGGAQELGNCPDLTFPAGDAGALQARLAAVLAGAVDVASYRRNARAPLTLAASLAQLRAHWAPAIASTAGAVSGHNRADSAGVTGDENSGDGRGGLHRLGGGAAGGGART